MLHHHHVPDFDLVVKHSHPGGLNRGVVPDHEVTPSCVDPGCPLNDVVSAGGNGSRFVSDVSSDDSPTVY